MLALTGFHNWFKSSIHKWLQIVHERSSDRIRRAVDMDKVGDVSVLLYTYRAVDKVGDVSVLLYTYSAVDKVGDVSVCLYVAIHTEQWTRWGLSLCFSVQLYTHRAAD